MMYGMQQMAAAGTEFATVAHFGHNKVARGLYQARGFKPGYLQDGYIKRMSTIPRTSKPRHTSGIFIPDCEYT